MDRSTQLTARQTGLATRHVPPSATGRHATGGSGPGIAYEPPAAATTLHVAAARVLDGNWTGTSTVPSRGLYPHQWSWDSAFIAIGLRHHAPERAQWELRTLLAAQWGDGRIPHIVFSPAVPLGAYFPSPDFWRSSTAGHTAGAPRQAETSGIVQPPVHALAAWLVHCADPGLSRARGFLAQVHAPLAAWHRYLLHRRDAGGGGLASVVHPWEQGMDNSPCWDVPLSRVEPAPAHTFRRADLDHGAVRDRPTDLDYGRYVRLAADYRDGHYADSARDFGAFAVEDPAFNALLIASEYALARIARELGADARAREARAAQLTRRLVARLWSPGAGMFLCRDVTTGRLLPQRGVSGLVPLIAPGLPPDVVDALVRTARGPHFALGGAARLVPSYDLTGEDFDPRRYWRGPAWFNTAWLVERGLRLQAATEPGTKTGHGPHDVPVYRREPPDGHGREGGHGHPHGLLGLADRLAAATTATAVSSGFAEYVDPYSGQGLGARGFGWSAALALDLLHDPSGRGSGGTWGTPHDTGVRREDRGGREEEVR